MPPTTLKKFTDKEVTGNFLRTDLRQKLRGETKRMDRSSRGTTSQLPILSDSDLKTGWTAIISKGISVGRMKKSGNDKLGRWSYQLLNGQGEKDILIICVYVLQESDQSKRNDSIPPTRDVTKGNT
jgi:hypothetical protein